MTLPRDLTTYGAPYQDALPVENPVNEQPADDYNRHAEDTAQGTRTSPKAVFDFLCVTSGTVSAANVNCRQQYGLGASTKPVVVRTGTGTYTATFATSYLDGLNTTETFSLFKALGTVESGTVPGVVQCTVSGAVATVYTFDMAGTLVDYTAGTKVGVVAW